jgi:hypothetical protein
MYIFVHTKVASPSEFKCDSNELIFSLIGHELDELCEFYKMFPEMEVFRAAPSVLQTAVSDRIHPKQSSCHKLAINWFSFCFLNALGDIPKL